MLLGLLLYAYCVGVRSSRAIERACHTDVAFRIACAQDIPDHTVIARFRGQYSDLFADLFSQVLLLCARAGMVKVGVIALDGTKIAANASMLANRSEDTLRKMATDILQEARELDEREDREERAGRGGGTPGSMSTRAERKETIQKALASIQAERAGKPSQRMRFSQRRLDAAQRKYETVLAEAQAGFKAQQNALARGDKITGRVRKDPHETTRVSRALARVRAAEEAMAAKLASEPRKKRNLTDVESRIMKTRNGFIQGYNAQLVVSEDHVIIACGLTDEPADTHQFAPMLDTCHTELAALAAAGQPRTIGVLTADSGYCSNDNLDPARTPGPDRLIAVAKDRFQRGDHPEDSPRTYTGPILTAMGERLKTPAGQAVYRRRGAIVEPVNAHLKDRRGLSRFSRRGLTACAAELKLAATATNILRYITLQAIPTPAT